MKVIIAGSRDISPTPWEMAKMLNGMEPYIDTVICGMAIGVDLAGKAWAESLNKPVIEMPADWDKNSKSAGPIRNKAMVDIADALVCIHNGSRGSANVMMLARKKGIPVKEILMSGNT